MPEMPPSLSAFNPVGGLSPNSRLSLGDDQQVKQSGTQHRGNIFARAWDFLTRTPDQVESNKQVAQEFVRGIREAYGDEVAGMVSRDLKGQLTQGRPLTAHRVERIMEKAGEMAGHIEAGNRQVMDRAFDSVLEGGVQRGLGERANDGVLSPQERREVVQRAIEGDPKFKATSFHTPMHVMLEQLGGDDNDLAHFDAPFIDHFTAVAAAALERAALAKLMPSTMAIIARDGDPHSPASDELQMGQLGRIGLSDDHQMQFQMAIVQVCAITDTLIDGETPPGIKLGQIGLLRAQGGPQVEGGEPRLSGLALDGPAREFRDALLQDMHGLDTQLSGSIGLDEFAPEVQGVLIGGYERSAGIQGAFEERGPQGLIDGLEHLGSLRAQLETMRGLAPEGEQAKALLDMVRTQTEKAVALLTLVENARTSGVTPDDLKAMHAAGLDIAGTLAKISDTGFHATDIAWLHTQGLDVGQALARFTPEEGAMLREAGVGIDVGLQYKDKGVPIHARTMVGELRSEMVSGEPRLLGGGALSKPYALTYGVRDMVFKEATPGEGYGPQSKRLGIDPGDPRMAVRNIASRGVDRALGFNVLPETHMGTMDGRLGVTLDMVHGSTPARNRSVDITDDQLGQNLLQARDLYEPEDFASMLEGTGCKLEGGRILQTQQFGVTDVDYSSPGLRSELVKLQLLDALTAQGDRHPGNYVVELDGEGGFTRLRGIDNDQAFGPKLLDPNELLHLGMTEPERNVDGRLYGDKAFNGVMLPPVVDTAMKKAFDDMTPDTLRRELEGLLPEKEIQAAVVRLSTIKAHIARLEIAGNVIKPDEWGSGRVTALLADPQTSYVGRDSQYIGTLEPITYEEARS